MIHSAPSLYPHNRRWKTGRRTTRQMLDQEMPLFDEEWLGGGAGSGEACPQSDESMDCQTSPQSELAQPKDVASSALLTLGGSQLLVRVHAEPAMAPSRAESDSPVETESDSSHLTAHTPMAIQLDAASAEIDDAAERDLRAARHRRALLDELEASESCETMFTRPAGMEQNDLWARRLNHPRREDRGSSLADRHRPDGGSPRAAASAGSEDAPQTPSHHRKPEPPFRWRRMWATAVCSGGAGCIALLLGQAVGI